MARGPPSLHAGHGGRSCQRPSVHFSPTNLAAGSMEQRALHQGNRSTTSQLSCL
jgi:hypothetical protein